MALKWIILDLNKDYNNHFYHWPWLLFGNEMFSWLISHYLTGDRDRARITSYRYQNHEVVCSAASLSNCIFWSSDVVETTPVATTGPNQGGGAGQGGGPAVGNLSYYFSSSWRVAGNTEKQPCFYGCTAYVHAFWTVTTNFALTLGYLNPALNNPTQCYAQYPVRRRIYLFDCRSISHDLSTSPWSVSLLSFCIQYTRIIQCKTE